MKTCKYCGEELSTTSFRLDICNACGYKLPVMKRLQKQLDELREIKRKRDERRYLGKI